MSTDLTVEAGHRSRRTTVVGAITVAVAVTASALVLGPVRADGSGQPAAAAPSPTGFSKLVKSRWTEFCQSDYCGSNAGIGGVELPAAWQGRTLRLTATATFNHRMRGAADDIRVGAQVADPIGKGRATLHPEQWSINKASGGYDTSTVQFARTVKVPADGVLSLTVNASTPKTFESFRVTGTKVLWTVSATG